MTTKARIAALQWFHDRGECPVKDAAVSIYMIRQMLNAKQLYWQPVRGNFSGVYMLTDWGRQVLHEATR